MDPHQPFLSAILARRHDTLPRLVYADFLEDTGVPRHIARAHFIRTQISLESADPPSALYADMKALEARLLDWFLEDWRFELPDHFRFGVELQNVMWRRGFPDDLGPLSVARFDAFGVPALRDHPLTALHLTERSESIRFQDYPELAAVAKLALTTFLPLANPTAEADESTVTFDSLVSAPVFTALRHLDLSGNQIDDAWLVRFATALPRASFAPTLESLDLSRNFLVTDAGANVLATTSALDGLTRLTVRDTDISKAGMAILRKRFGSRLGTGNAVTG